MSLAGPFVERAALAWLASARYHVRNGADIAPSELRVKEPALAIKETTV